MSPSATGNFQATNFHDANTKKSKKPVIIALCAILAIALVAGIDRIFDMGRTTINITGDAACAIIVSRMEDRREARKAAKENGAA